ASGWSLTGRLRTVSGPAPTLAEADTPLSGNLKDSPWERPAVYLFGETRAHASAFQSALALTVLLPESFRGGCSFGAGPRTSRRAARSLPSGCLRHGRDLSTASAL